MLRSPTRKFRLVRAPLPSLYFAPQTRTTCRGDSRGSAVCKTVTNHRSATLTLTEPPVSARADPAMTLVLSTGLGLDMTAKDYLLKGSPLAASPDLYCIGIKDGGSAGGTGFIIGDTTMRNYYLVFDLAEKRIGWGPVNKETCGSI